MNKGSNHIFGPSSMCCGIFFFQAEDGIRDLTVTGVQTCALPIYGDADRVGGMDGRGGYVSTNQIISLLLHHLVVNRKRSGRMIKALTTTSMVKIGRASCRERG